MKKKLKNSQHQQNLLVLIEKKSLIQIECISQYSAKRVYFTIFYSTAPNKIAVKFIKLRKQNVKGVTKSYYTQYSCVVIVV